MLISRFSVPFLTTLDYIQKTPITLYDKYPAFAYVCCDIKRRADETVKVLKEAQDDGLADAEVIERLQKAGKFVLLASLEMSTKEILPLYYLRQSAEQIFQISKSYADILPLRIHSEDAFRGVLFLNFLSVILYINFRKQLPKGTSVEAALKQMRNLMCKVYDDDSIVKMEPNKKQRVVLEAIANTGGIF